MGNQNQSVLMMNQSNYLEMATRAHAMVGPASADRLVDRQTYTDRVRRHQWRTLRIDDPRWHRQ